MFVEGKWNKSAKKFSSGLLKAGGKGVSQRKFDRNFPEMPLEVPLGGGVGRSRTLDVRKSNDPPL